MVFNSIFPICMECVWFTYRTAFRLKSKLGMDISDEYPTKCTSIQQYINLWAGPQYFMHYKYSSIMNIIFLTMLFGPGMPLMFPVAALSLIVLYLLEVYMLYYVYKAPPAYDELLNNSVLSNLAFAPLFMLSYGYWMLSSLQLRQTYEKLYPLSEKGGTFYAEHYWYDSLSLKGLFASGPASILLILFFLYFVYLLFRGILLSIMKRLQSIECCRMQSLMLDEIRVDEDLPSYQDVLDEDDKNWTIKEEENCRQYGMQTMLDHGFNEIKNAKQFDMKTGKHLQGIHTYNILRNPAYITQFQYFSADLPDREDMIVDGDQDESNDCAQSDLVKIALNLAFLRKEEVESLEFTDDGLAKLKKS